MDRASPLHNQLVIAMPGMADPNFNSTVTLICEHNDRYQRIDGIYLLRVVNERMLTEKIANVI